MSKANIETNGDLYYLNTDFDETINIIPNTKENETLQPNDVVTYYTSNEIIVTRIKEIKKYININEAKENTSCYIPHRKTPITKGETYTRYTNKNGKEDHEVLVIYGTIVYTKHT